MHSMSKRRFFTSALAIGFMLQGLSIDATAASKFNNAGVAEGPTITALTIGRAVAKTAISLLGQHVGSGECTDLAAEALRLATARPGTNYVWGTPVSKGSKIQTGDIIQFWNARFTGPAGQEWGTLEGGQHTAVILAVSGTVLNLVHQNFPAGSPVVRGSIDLSWSHTGSYEIYRPIAQ